MTTGNIKKNSLLFRIWEYFAICVVLHYCVFCLLNITRFNFNYNDTFRTITFTLVVVTGSLRLITGLLTDIRMAKDRKAIISILCKLFAAILFSLPCIYLAHKYNYSWFAYYPFLAFCLYKVNGEHFIKCFTLCISVLFLTIVFCALSGSIQNLVYLGGGIKGDIRGAYGFPYPTDFAAYFVFLFLFWWCIQRQQSWLKTLVTICLAVVLAYVIYVFTLSRNSSICIILAAAAVLYDKLCDTDLFRSGKTKWITKTVDTLTIAAFPLMAIAIAGMTWLYASGSGLGIKLNSILSDRLLLIWNSIQKYGIHSMGTLTPQSGWGGVLIKTREYDFLDSSYALMIIRYGWIFFLIACFIWVWMTRKAVKTGNRKLALAMGVIALHAMVEHHFPELNYNLLFIMPLCVFTNKEQRETHAAARTGENSGLIAGLLSAGIFIMLLPRMLSWSKFLFVRWGWTGGGESSFYAFLFWLFILLAFIGFWLFLRATLKELTGRKQINGKAIAGLAGLICLFAVAGLWTNAQIDRERTAYEAQISADNAAISFVLDNSEEPVYAGQAEGEVYHRSFRGLSDWVLSPEELARKGFTRGSMLLEHDNEGHQLAIDGAKYAELSPYTGIYTYDDKLAEKLSKAGYVVSDHYSAEREEDLAFFLKRNEVILKEDGTLKLGPGIEKSLIHGVFMNQYRGNYRVTYSLELVHPEQWLSDPEQKICILRAAAMYGQDVRNQINIYAKDFNENGELIVTLDYSVEDTIGVEHLVYCSEGVELILKRLAWKQL